MRPYTVILSGLFLEEKSEDPKALFLNTPDTLQLQLVINRPTHLQCHVFKHYFTCHLLGRGYFMHFSTAGGMPGDKTLLESRILYPRRGFQCLQFFLFNSGHDSDQLKIWVREFDKANPNGTLRLIERINGTALQTFQCRFIEATHVCGDQIMSTLLNHFLLCRSSTLMDNDDCF